MTPNLHERLEEKLRDPILRKNLRKATDHSLKLRDEVVAELGNWEELREEARRIKRDVVMRLPQYLDQAERRLREHGIKVVRALDADAACHYILDIAKAKGAKLAVKSKSMATEEIGLAHALQAVGVTAVETDLGEYIVQLAGEMPSHITAPAIHKSREQIGKLFEEKLSVPYTSSPEELTAIARRTMRELFLKADIGISGANFLIAENGMIVIIENEGNICLTTSLPKTHIAVIGIEKIIPRLADLPLFLKLLPRSATGQRMTSYVSLINSPRREDETDGPEEVHVVLLDNGRSRIRIDPGMNDILTCIKCGACLNSCPVYQKIGGHAYGWVYPGPIGALLSPALKGMEPHGELPFLSTLCGACRDVCPVKIDIHGLLLRMRGRYVRGGHSSIVGGIAMKAWSFVMSNRRLYGLVSRVLRAIAVLPGAGRIPKPAPRTFHEIWSDGHDAV